MDIDNAVTQLARRCVVLQDLISEAGRGGGSGQLGTLNRSSLNGRNSTVLWQVGVCRNDCTQRTASYRTKKKEQAMSIRVLDASNPFKTLKTSALLLSVSPVGDTSLFPRGCCRLVTTLLTVDRSMGYASCAC